VSSVFVLVPTLPRKADWRIVGSAPAALTSWSPLKVAAFDRPATRVELAVTAPPIAARTVSAS